MKVYIAQCTDDVGLEIIGVYSTEVEAQRACGGHTHSTGGKCQEDHTVAGFEVEGL